MKNTRNIEETPFAYVAFWQFMMFILLLLLVWVSELMDLPALLFDADPSPVDLVGTYVLSLGIVVVAIITVGHTYLQQKHIIRGFLKICASCRRIRINEERWEWAEEYISRHSLALVSHGLCPACLQMEKDKLVSQQAKADNKSS